MKRLLNQLFQEPFESKENLLNRFIALRFRLGWWKDIPINDPAWKEIPEPFRRLLSRLEAPQSTVLSHQLDSQIWKPDLKKTVVHYENEIVGGRYSFTTFACSNHKRARELISGEKLLHFQIHLKPEDVPVMEQC